MIINMNNKIKKILFFFSTFLPYSFAYAINIPNPLSNSVGNSLLSLLNVILTRIIMPIAAIFVVVWIIWAGFTYVTANGNPAKIKTAHQRLLWALVGAVILLGAAGISAVVQNTVNGLIS